MRDVGGGELVIFRASIAAFWILVIGLACVYLEYSQVRLGHRIHGHLERLDEIRNRLHSLEIKYSCLISPDVLEKDLAEFVKGDVLDMNPGI